MPDSNRGLKKHLTRKRVLPALIALDILVFVLRGPATIGILLALGLGLYGLIRLVKGLFRRSSLIWRLRHRLIVTYMFIGGVPILLILALSYIGAWIIVGQVATYLVGSELSRRAAALESPAKFLANAKPAERAAISASLLPFLRDRVPGFEIMVTGSGQTLHVPETSSLEAPPDGWNNYTGVVHRNGVYYLMGFAKNGGTQALLLAPLDVKVLEKLVPGIGSLSIYNLSDALSDSAPIVAAPKGSSKDFRLSVNRKNIDITPTIAGTPPPAYNVVDREFPWLNNIDIAEWTRPNTKGAAALLVTTRTSAVLATVFADRLETAQGTLAIFIGIAIILAFVELISVLIGVSMTRTITGAVHNLYEGTLRISKGDFSTHVPVKGTDQLADLGNSFNQMTDQLRSLVQVAKEKERLQSELFIATEVQNQLFPRSAPSMKTIQLLGACEPARSVSGDYYDYLCLPNGNLAVAIGDVAGKGISAALLMASIQSIMRTQLLAGMPRHGSGNGLFSTANVVEQLSRQLYSNTSPEKYATFFFGLYDEESRRLKYTNAGHLSPLLVSGGTVTPLEVTGTVIGMFPLTRFEEQEISIGSGDLLIAYTDGITEPENSYGEEYGVDRLAELVQKNQTCALDEMVAKVREAVKQWSGAPELPDDMTVLIAKGI